jgi:hypothetical protein
MIRHIELGSTAFSRFRMLQSLIVSGQITLAVIPKEKSTVRFPVARVNG